MDDETNPTVLMREAVAAHLGGDLAAAEELYRAAAAAGDTDAAFQLGVILEDAGREQEAIDAYRQALVRGDREARLNLANLLADVDAISDLNEAERLYQEAIAAGDARAFFDYGTVLARLDRGSEAEELFLRAIERGEMRGHRGIAWLRLAGLDNEGAVASYEHAIRGGDEESRDALAGALRERGILR